MLLFIIIFFASLIIIGASAVLGFSFYLKRQSKRLRAENQTRLNPPSPEYHGLFAPTDEELRAREREKYNAQKAKAAELARQEAEEKLTTFADYKNAWRARPERKNTIELLRQAAETESAKTFSETASMIVEMWREGQVENLSAPDLADLLDSHLRILPQQERTSGALFWLREEINQLRFGSEGSK